MSPTTKNKIEDLVSKNKVILFMKGNRNFPQCGFSSTVVQILSEILDDYETFNVLESPEIRSGIKEFAEWPTIPQLYINGEFVGGCDIIKQMSASGDLHKELGVEKSAPTVPNFTVSDSAAAELKKALADAEEGESVHIHVSPGFQHDMSVGPQSEAHVSTEVAGLPFSFDGASARRAEGLHIDFVTEGAESGFKLENPNAKRK